MSENEPFKDSASESGNPAEEQSQSDRSSAIDADEPVSDDPEKVEQAERLLREANLARVRGTATVADRLLKEASELAPNTPSVLEALGDDFVARSQYRRAKEMYARAHQIDPTNTAIENKFGEMVLRVDLHIDPASYADEMNTFARPGILMFLSALIPGVGQMVVERYVKGGVMLAIYLACMGGIAMLPGGFKLIGSLISGKGEFNPIAAFLLGVIGIDALWSVVDLGSLKSRPVKKIDRPTPPVDGF